MNQKEQQPAASSRTGIGCWPLFMQTVNGFRNLLNAEGILFAYAGALSPDIITSLLHMLDNKLKLLGLGVRRKKNLVNIAIECLQNIHYHGWHDQEQAIPFAECMMALQSTPEGLKLWFSNEISAEDKLMLEERIQYLNQLNSDQLHQEYLDVLNKGLMTAKGGGGLGLIRILRESGQPLAYSFEPHASLPHFHMNLVVSLTVESPVFIIPN